MPKKRAYVWVVETQYSNVRGWKPVSMHLSRENAEDQKQTNIDRWHAAVVPVKFRVRRYAATR